jgi:hypothetical protein
LFEEIMPNRISKTSAQRGSALLAVIIASVVLVILGGMAASLVFTNYRVARTTFTRADLNHHAEAVASRLAAARLSGRGAGFFTVGQSGITFDDRNASGDRFLYTARTAAAESGITRVHVVVHPLTPARGEYAKATASY